MEVVEKLQKKLEREKKAKKTLEDLLESRTRELYVEKIAAQESSRIKSEFMANISHEIRTPMNAILGMIHLAIQMEPPPEMLEYLNKTQASAGFLQRIISDILDFSDLEAGKVNLQSASFDLEEVLSNLADMTRMQAEEKNLGFCFRLPADLPTLLEGDSFRLSQVLIRMVDNAIKFTKEGEVVVEVAETENKEDGVFLEFSVSDTGTGMAGDQTSEIFDAFTQADGSSTRTHGGIGLGLTVCRRIIELMGGEITVESKLGKGTRFSFSAHFKHQERVDPPDLREGLAGTKVLVIGEDTTSRQILMDHLESLAADVLTAESGSGAELILSENPEKGQIDLVLLDQKVSDLDSLMTGALLDDKSMLGGVPFILISSLRGRQSSCAKYCKCNFRVIEKPFMPGALLKAIREALDAGAPPGSRSQEVPEESPYPGLDFQGSMARIDNDRELLENLMKTFRDEFADVLVEIKRALDGNDQEQVFALLHNLKGVSGNVGFMDVSRAAKSLEDQLRQGSDESISENVEELGKFLKQAFNTIAGLCREEPMKEDSEEQQQVDIDAVAPLVKELSHLLSTNSFDCDRCLKSIKEKLPRGVFAEEIMELDGFVSRYDFEGAVPVVSRMVERMGIGLKESA
ncbi:MAG: ATP-binding protein [bacterium]